MDILVKQRHSWVGHISDIIAVDNPLYKGKRTEEQKEMYSALMGRRCLVGWFFFFLNDRAPTEFSPLPLPAALPILWGRPAPLPRCRARGTRARRPRLVLQPPSRNQVVLDAPLVRQPPDDEVPPIACLQRSQG